MTDDRPDQMDGGAGALAPALAVDAGSWAAEPEFDLPMLAPSPVPVIAQAELGEILADSLFGEVIELGDLIPHLLAPQGEVAGDAAASFVAAGPVESAGETMIFHAPFTILFEEDGSSGHGTL